MYYNHQSKTCIIKRCLAVVNRGFVIVHLVAVPHLAAAGAGEAESARAGKLPL